jgi:hypothetical protein
MSRSLFEIAQEYERHGYVCIPVNVTLDANDKKVIQAPSAWRTRVFDQLEDWTDWGGKPYTGIAVDTARSGIVAVDVDTSHGKDGFAGLDRAGISLELLDTNGMVQSQSGGQHRLFRACSIPLKDSVSKLADDVDIKAEGMLIAAPTEPTPGRAYKWLPRPIPVKDLPEFPKDLARLLAESESKFTVEVGGYTPADVTDAQRDWALRKIEQKLADIAEAGAGQRWDASKALPRIFGIAKTIGEDLDALGDKALAAFFESGGDDEDRFIGSVARAIRNAQPENPLRWLPKDRQRSFWDVRPSLAHVRQAARHHRASPWGVLGALCVRVLADVPTTYRLVTGCGPDIVPNVYVALGSDSGGGKGLAASTARQLWRSGARVDMPSSGEALRMMFAYKVGGEQQWHEPRSVIVNAPEVVALRAGADRPGSSLIGMLCNGFFGDSLSMSVVDQSKNVDVPDGSYRLGVITGVQYGNAGVLLTDASATTGLAQRLAWFPANVKREEQAKIRPEWPGRLQPAALHGGPNIGCDPVVADALDEIKVASSAGELDPLDGHRGLVQLKLAYALAILDGHCTSVRTEDWELAGVMMEVSTETRKRALQVVGDRAKSRAQEEGARVAEVESASYERKLATVMKRITDKLSNAPRCHISRGELNRSLTSYQRPMLDEALNRLADEGRVTLTGEGKALNVADVAGP